jgi:REP element-mobilizing transposase RayT
MVYDADRYHRWSIRLKDYDYSQPGAYFVTICVEDRACLLGQISDEEIICNDAGKMVAWWWAELSHKFPNVEIDEFIVMPNHFHGIVVLIEQDHVGADPRVRPGGGTHAGVPLHTVVQWFKTMTTNEYIREVKQSGWRPFPGKLWQRNYYEHIIRDEIEWNLIRNYIINNPMNWENDREFNEDAR